MIIPFSPSLSAVRKALRGIEMKTVKYMDEEIVIKKAVNAPIKDWGL